MDKISGILPSSRRVSSVDMQNATPVRPGTPTFGRPIGISTLAVPDLIVPTTAQKAMAEFDAEMAPKKSIDPKADIVQTMTDNFFIKRATSAPAQGLKDNDFNPQMVAAQLPPESEVQFTPPGTLLNVSA